MSMGRRVLLASSDALRVRTSGTGRSLRNSASLFARLRKGFRKMFRIKMTSRVQQMLEDEDWVLLRSGEPRSRYSLILNQPPEQKGRDDGNAIVNDMVICDNKRIRRNESSCTERTAVDEDAAMNTLPATNTTISLLNLLLAVSVSGFAVFGSSFFIFAATYYPQRWRCERVWGGDISFGSAKDTRCSPSSAGIICYLADLSTTVIQALHTITSGIQYPVYVEQHYEGTSENTVNSDTYVGMKRCNISQTEKVAHLGSILAVIWIRWLLPGSADRCRQ
ncbi:uncharacterized protein F5891DRAFT_1171582 [Suillus fuscotomentosus]|uniref:Uncharacterized protein n=1 Tax=Suillus fuscotomentosus TaxID=1912939 RepID=A0AAD4HNT2_9AGAM|nr:uncharacterized protein F5891DRAFT_1171582 [Suillus fuscotomentosus]KAG1903433.1 hypothetical protein F5891DRAFT_1171582 [Suillus fuscotomentosus]